MYFSSLLSGCAVAKMRELVNRGGKDRVLPVKEDNVNMYIFQFDDNIICVCFAGRILYSYNH